MQVEAVIGAAVVKRPVQSAEEALDAVARPDDRLGRSGCGGEKEAARQKGTGESIHLIFP
ncbi:hypothetical protein GCM10009116_12880 [Brevundimonas basaltis]